MAQFKGVECLKKEDLEKLFNDGHVELDDGASLDYDEGTAYATEEESSLYDLTIRTQEEFENWGRQLNEGTDTARSVLLVGDGGDFHFKGAIDLSKSSVEKISGINNAILEGKIEGKTHYVDDGKISEYYNDLADKFSIDNITIIRNGYTFYDPIKNELSAGPWCFSRLKNLYNCMAYIDVTDGYVENYAATVAGFERCENLVNCKATNVAGGVVAGFWNCKHLINCDADVSGASYHYNAGFWYCKQMINCDSYAYDPKVNVPSFGFRDCYLISNCRASAIKNADTPSNMLGAYGIYDCDYVSNCRALPTGNSSGLLGGSNTHVDEITVA